jgi:hypothetical protein
MSRFVEGYNGKSKKHVHRVQEMFDGKASMGPLWLPLALSPAKAALTE